MQPYRNIAASIIDRAKTDKTFRRNMLMRGITLLIAGNKEDVQVGKAFIRDYINATIGFPKLAEKTGLPKESLMRMFGPSGNPALNNLNLVTQTLLQSEGVREPDNVKVTVRA